MFYSVGIFSTSSLGGSISSNPERTALRRREEEPGCTEVLWQRAASLNIKRLLIIKENQISQVKEFTTFLCIGMASLIAQLVKSNAEDPGSISGLGRSPGERKGYPLQYSGLENSRDCTVHGVRQSRTRLSNFHFHFSITLNTLRKINCHSYMLQIFVY